MFRATGVLPLSRRFAGLTFAHLANKPCPNSWRTLPSPQTPISISFVRQKVTHCTQALDTVMQKPLDVDAGPLVWIDCEMTGLDPRKDRILEIAVLITDGDLNLVDNGIEYVIRTEKKYLDAMDEWCTTQHGSSGLTEACLNSPYSTEFAAQSVLAYIQKWIPKHKAGVLAGNSVHADRSFLVNEMPEVVDWLHYRIVDVSSIKELSKRWYPSRKPPKDLYRKSNHRALDDIQGSLRELKWYRGHIFIEPGWTSPGEPSMGSAKA